MMKTGSYTTTEKYEEYLSKQIQLIEQDNPLAHIKKYDIRKDNACEEIDKFLTDNPHVIISLAYFDFDIYEPTRKCLEKIRNRIIKGSILAFDEINDKDCPGETLALMEVFGLPNVKLKRLPYVSRVSYFVYE